MKGWIVSVGPIVLLTYVFACFKYGFVNGSLLIGGCVLMSSIIVWWVTYSLEKWG